MGLILFAFMRLMSDSTGLRVDTGIKFIFKIRIFLIVGLENCRLMVGWAATCGSEIGRYIRRLVVRQMRTFFPSTPLPRGISHSNLLVLSGIGCNSPTVEGYSNSTHELFDPHTNNFLKRPPVKTPIFGQLSVFSRSSDD